MGVGFPLQYARARARGTAKAPKSFGFAAGGGIIVPLKKDRAHPTGANAVKGHAMSTELLGYRQRELLRAMASLEAEHGAGRWFFLHAVLRRVAPADPPGGRGYRPAGIEQALNPSRIIATLADRGLVERNAMYSVGSSVRLTNAGRHLAAALGPAASLASQCQLQSRLPAPTETHPPPDA